MRIRAIRRGSRPHGGTAPGPRKRARRGVSLPVVLAVILIVALVTSAFLPQLAGQERMATEALRRAHALQAADAGVDYKLHRLRLGLLPGRDPTEQQLLSVGGTDRQFRVRTELPPRGPEIVIRSEGFAEGTRRRILARALPVSLFNTFVLYGITRDPTVDAIHFHGNYTATGAVGVNGLFRVDNKVATIVRGPLVLAGPDADVYRPGRDPQFVNPVENPIRRWPLPLNLPTVTEIANAYSGTQEGLAYFRRNNANNAARPGGKRGIYWVGRKENGDLIEIPVNMGDDTVLDHRWLHPLGQTPGNSSALPQGMKEFLGAKFYPGHYYFTQIRMEPNEWDTIIIHNEPVDSAGDARVIFWLDRPPDNQDRDSTLTPTIQLVNYDFPTRFRIFSRIYDAGIRLHGPKKPDDVYYLNIYAYDRKFFEGRLVSYGYVNMESSATVRGSIWAYAIDVGGGGQIIHHTDREPDPTGPDLPMLFITLTSWQELD